MKFLAVGQIVGHCLTVWQLLQCKYMHNNCLGDCKRVLTGALDCSYGSILIVLFLFIIVTD